MSYIDKYKFYDGAESINELLSTIENLGMEKSKCYFIKFKEMYYAVFFDSTSREMVIGSKNSTAFYSRNGRLEEEYLECIPNGYIIKTRNNSEITKTLAIELNTIDKNLKVYGFPNAKSNTIKDVTDKFSESKYVVLLALTFCSKYYDLHELDDIKKYFVAYKEIQRFLLSTKGAVRVNPFKQLIEYTDGTIGAYAIRYYFDTKLKKTQKTFALTESNKFTEDTRKRRKWLSITQYKNLYPYDFIDYPKPDYREDKNTCKWCGAPLPEGKSSFCSKDCSLEFAKATYTNQGELLGYRILCRDTFKCTRCGKDLASINKFGIKIPTSKLCDYPDKDGIYRREAEVHHKNRVADGGSDQKDNLVTLCCECHLETEGKKSRQKNNKNCIF